MVADGLLEKMESESKEILGFADDMVILINGKHVGTLIDLMQRALTKTETWRTTTELSVNPSKTNMILFTRGRDQLPTRRPKLFGRELEWSEDVKYLGIILDKKLTWTPHLNHRIQKATNAFWMLRSAIGNS